MLTSWGQIFVYVQFKYLFATLFFPHYLSPDITAAIKAPAHKVELQTYSQLDFKYNDSSWRPFRPLDFVLRALRALRPCDPRVGDWIVC